MAFKISSIDIVKKDADHLAKYSQTVISESKTIIANLEELSQVVTGGGVDITLARLIEIFDTYIKYLSNRQQKISQFIDKQMVDYSNITSGALEGLKKSLENTLNSSNGGGE